LRDLREDAKDLFPTIYLTLVSMVQALALEELLDVALRGDPPPAGARGALLSLQLFAVFVGLLVVWHDYVLGVIRYRYVVGIQDSLIPFLLAFGEFGLIESTRRGSLVAWFRWWAVLLGMGVWIYVHQYTRARADPANGDVDARWGPFTLRQRVAFLTGGALAALALAAWVRVASPPPALLAAVVAALGASLVGYAALTALSWLRVTSPSR
jgi:hypothetical protein